MRDQLPLRDRLALDRTDLANRRTWLAYARTGLALFIAGASFLQFFDQGWMSVVAWIFMAMSGPVVLAGWWRFRRLRRRIDDDAQRAAQQR